MLAWLAENWFETVQTAGIVGSLLYAGASFGFDSRVRRTEINLSLTEAHRQLWETLIENPDLERINDPNADPESTPATPEERWFITMLVAHIDSVRQATKAGVFHMAMEMERDIADFSALPLPRSVIQSILPYQRPEFRQYLETLLGM